MAMRGIGRHRRRCPKALKSRRSGRPWASIIEIWYYPAASRGEAPSLLRQGEQATGSAGIFLRPRGWAARRVSRGRAALTPLGAPDFRPIETAPRLFHPYTNLRG